MSVVRCENGAICALAVIAGASRASLADTKIKTVAATADQCAGSVQLRCAFLTANELRG